MTQKKFTFGRDVIYLLLVLLCATIVIAFWHLMNLSLSPSYIATRGGLLLYPREATLDNYARVIGNRYIWLGYKNTLIRTCIGTVLQLFFTAMGAYVLSKRFFPHRTFWTLFIVFTMFFSGGLIPNYLLVKNLGLLDTYASMILPGFISAYNLVIMRNFFQSLPEEIEESCLIDGAGRFRKMWHITLPGIKPTIVVLLIMSLGNILGGGFDRPFAFQNNLVMRVADVIATFVYRVGIKGLQFSLTTAVGLFQSVVGVFFLLMANWISRKLGERGIW